MSTGILPSFWTPADLTAAQQRLASEASQVHASVTVCTALDATSKAGWTAFYTQLTNFCAIQFGWLTTTYPDGSWNIGGGTGVTADLIEQYGRTLFAWEQKLQKVCSLGVAVVDPDQNPGALAVQNVVKYAVVGAAFIASAYAIGKIVSVVPRREVGST